ncbi:Integrase catalytic domain-containing protein [Mycena chlorophos]|uniref:Integrase catalytic domain-containing protein n=1 Tax=Mycena chlorophos TaxID=658473 RepID=A0A8H6TQ22_MYCCL|nr:Integrase catalytic domain-containing protein [Mycena chlorophos]
MGKKSFKKTRPSAPAEPIATTPPRFACLDRDPDGLGSEHDLEDPDSSMPSSTVTERVAPVAEKVDDTRENRSEPDLSLERSREPLTIRIPPMASRMSRTSHRHSVRPATRSTTRLEDEHDIRGPPDPIDEAARENTGVAASVSQDMTRPSEERDEVVAPIPRPVAVDPERLLTATPEWRTRRATAMVFAENEPSERPTQDPRGAAPVVPLSTEEVRVYVASDSPMSEAKRFLRRRGKQAEGEDDCSSNTSVWSPELNGNARPAIFASESLDEALVGMITSLGITPAFETDAERRLRLNNLDRMRTQLLIARANAARAQLEREQEDLARRLQTSVAQQRALEESIYMELQKGHLGNPHAPGGSKIHPAHISVMSETPDESQSRAASVSSKPNDRPSEIYHRHESATPAASRPASVAPRVRLGNADDQGGGGWHRPVYAAPLQEGWTPSKVENATLPSKARSPIVLTRRTPAPETPPPKPRTPIVLTRAPVLDARPTAGARPPSVPSGVASDNSTEEKYSNIRADWTVRPHRVATYARDGDLRDFGQSAYPDQGIRFANGDIRDLRAEAIKQSDSNVVPLMASADYENVKYDATGGVDGLYTSMQTAANRMLDPPSEIEMRKQFMRLIPGFIRKELVHRDRLPEYTPLTILVDTARLIEHGRRTLALLDGSTTKDKRLQVVQEVDDSDDGGEMMAYGRRQQDGRERRFFPRKNGGGRDERKDERKEDTREYRRDEREGRDREYKRREGRDDRGQGPRAPLRAADAAPERDERMAAAEDDDDGDDYRSDYTIEEVSVASDKSADEHMGFGHEEDVPELQDVSDSSDEEDSGDEQDRELDQLAQEMANHYLASGSVSDTFEYFGAAQPRPPKDWHKAYCLTAFVSINGKEAFTLFDSGCTTDAVSPDFARVAALRVFPLETPMTLQLGTAGSRAKIVHGANAEVQYGGVKSSEYLDVVNIDRFDAILGTKFMRKHAIALDFERNQIRRAGRDLPTLSAETEHAVIERRAAARHSAEH